MTQESITARIAQLQEMSVGELREKWRELYGEAPRSRHRVWLWKRLAWRIQELEYGGLSERAKQRLEELMPNAELALRVPRDFMKGVAPARSRHRQWLFKRLAWRVQEIAFGGLSERTKKRLEELMPTAELALRVPKGFLEEHSNAPGPASRSA